MTERRFKISRHRVPNPFVLSCWQVHDTRCEQAPRVFLYLWEAVKTARYLNRKEARREPADRPNPNHITVQGGHTMFSNTITVNGVEYVPATAPSEWRIVIAQRGWVFVGRWHQDGDNVTLTDAKNIRTWGTTKGLGELAESGPTAKTILDPAGTVRLHALAVVATLDTAHTSW